MNSFWQRSVLCTAAFAVSLSGCAGRNPLTAFNPLSGRGDHEIAVNEPAPGSMQPSYLGGAINQPPPSEKGLSAGVAAAMKNAGASVANALTIKPKVIPANDPIDLSSDPGPLGSDLFISAGQIHEQRGNFEAAKAQYQRALDTSPSDLNALLSFARVHDRLEQFDRAIAIYEQTVNAHPNSSIAWNDLGLCYARLGNLDRSIATLQRAVEVDPKKGLYRNNLARVLIEVGQNRQAFDHLAAVHGPAVAHYNLGYFLYQRQQLDEAVHHFAQAVQIDPSLTAARDMLHRMGAVPGPNRHSANGVNVENEGVHQVVHQIGDELGPGIWQDAEIEAAVEGEPAETAVYVVEDPSSESLPDLPGEINVVGARSTTDAAIQSARQSSSGNTARSSTDYGSAFN